MKMVVKCVLLVNDGQNKRKDGFKREELVLL